jgi:hypothetical protein
MRLEEAFESILQRFPEQEEIQAIYIDCRKTRSRGANSKVVRVKLRDDTMYQLVFRNNSMVWGTYTL